MALHVIFIDNQGQQLSDVTSNFTSVQIPQNAFIMRIADDAKSYSNSTFTKLFEIDNTFYSKILEYTLKGDYQVIDIGVQDFGGFTAIFNQLSAQFVGNNPPTDIYDFSGYGGSSGGNIDFSTIVTALNSIAAALSALTNLSNLSNLSQLADIITAIDNKDNQSDIVDCLNFIFTYDSNDHSSITERVSAIKNVSTSNDLNTLSRVKANNLLVYLRQIMGCLTFADLSQNTMNTTLSNNSILKGIYYSLNSVSRSGTSNSTPAIINPGSFLKAIDDKLNNIETKLEQNLPFVTNVYPLVETNVDFPYEVKILNKDNCSDNKKNDI